MTDGSVIDSDGFRYGPIDTGSPKPAEFFAEAERIVERWSEGATTRLLADVMASDPPEDVADLAVSVASINAIDQVIETMERPFWETYRNERDALEDRIEKAVGSIEELQQALARGGWYERAETCASILDVLNGVER